MSVNSVRLLLCISLLTLLVGCPTETPFEGDETGECSDNADNDRDGLFDCDDSDCANAPECTGDDDDATGDDDDATGDDDDATGDDDDATGDDDDATGDDDDSVGDDDDSAGGDDDDSAGGDDDDSAADICANVGIPGAALVANGAQSYSAQGDIIWACAGSTVTSSGGNPTIFLEPGATATVSGDNGLFFVPAGATLTLSGNNGWVNAEVGSTTTVTGSGSLENTCVIIYDTSNAPANGCN